MCKSTIFNEDLDMGQPDISVIEQKYEELGKLIASYKAIKDAFPRTIQAPELNEGEIWAGTLLKPDGTGHHIILLPGEKDEIKWQAALDWAKELGGDLPNREEQAILFAHSKDQFQEYAYWSNTEHSDSSYAWYQIFDGGLQYYTPKSNELRARAVRRLPI